LYFSRIYKNKKVILQKSLIKVFISYTDKHWFYLQPDIWETPGITEPQAKKISSYSAASSNGFSQDSRVENKFQEPDNNWAINTSSSYNLLDLQQVNFHIRGFISKKNWFLPTIFLFHPRWKTYFQVKILHF
jgi:hypothetical protein